MLKDQQLLAKQQEITGKAVAQLTLQQPKEHQEEPPSPTDSDSTMEDLFQGRGTRFKGDFANQGAGTSNHRHQQ